DERRRARRVRPRDPEAHASGHGAAADVPATRDARVLQPCDRHGQQPARRDRVERAGMGGGAMMALAIRRAIEAVPALIVVSIIMFGLLALGPNPLELLKQNPAITAADVDRLTKLNGWDKPVVEQYFSWAG